MGAQKPGAPKSHHQKYVEKIEMMLPWGLEQRVSAVLIFIKVPLIVVVFFIGLAAELVVKVNTLESWSRGGQFFPGGRTSCFTHHMKASLSSNLGDFGIVEAINATLLRGGVNTTALFVHNLTIDPLADLAGQQDTCVIHARETAPNSGEFDCGQVGGESRGGPWGGIDHHVPLALLWAICKFLYIGIHPVDRLVKQVSGAETPPEPVFKLLTEPHFQVCTFPMFVVMKVFHFIQYRLMPNALLAALASMEAHPLCPEWMLYRFDWLWGSLCYYMVLLDLAGVGVGYAAFSTVARGRMVGTNAYRCYKLLWFMKGICVCTWPALALFYTFGGVRALVEAARGLIRVVVSLDFRFAISVDVLRIFVVLVVILEVIELQFFILGLICPRLLGALPCCAALEDPEEDTEAGRKDEVVPLVRAPNGGSKGGSTLGNVLKNNAMGKVHKGMPKMPEIPVLRRLLPGRR